MLVALGWDEPAGHYGGPRSIHLLLSPRNSHTADELHRRSALAAQPTCKAPQQLGNSYSCVRACTLKSTGLAVRLNWI